MLAPDIAPTWRAVYPGIETLTLSTRDGHCDATQGLSDESWGLENVRVTANRVEVIATKITDAAEGGSPGQIKFTRSGGDTLAPLDVTIELDGDATEGDDFQTVSRIVSFAANETEKIVTFVPIDDDLDEDEEQIYVGIKPGNAYWAPDQLVVMLVKDGGVADTAPTITWSQGPNKAGPLRISYWQDAFRLGDSGIVDPETGQPILIPLDGKVRAVYGDDIAINIPVKAKFEMDLEAVILQAPGDGPPLVGEDVVADQIKAAKEIWAQAGIRINSHVSVVLPPNSYDSEIPLSVFKQSTLDNGKVIHVPTAVAKDIVNTFNGPANTVRAYYVSTFGNGLAGLAVADWGVDNAAGYVNSVFVTIDGSQLRRVLAHELGHLINLRHPIDRADVKNQVNLMAASGPVEFDGTVIDGVRLSSDQLGLLNNPKRNQTLALFRRI